MLPEATQLWDRVAQSYPSSDQSFQGAYFAGILHYRMNDFDAATTSMNRALLLAIEPLEKASAYLWLGKVSQKQGDNNQAKQYWQLGSNSRPLWLLWVARPGNPRKISQFLPLRAHQTLQWTWKLRAMSLLLGCALL